ncbi:MAG: antibiotic biosynthesis monooxygenase family protein [Candidatus Binatia bacterium]
MIRVLIERKVGGSTELAYQKLTRDVRHAAMQMPGYISGETWRDAANHRHYVLISTWRTRGEWDAWAGSPERLAATEQIAPMLLEPEAVTILEPL